MEGGLLFTLPFELRLQIFETIFGNIICPTEPRLSRNRLLVKEFDKKLTLLHICKTWRNEALAIFKKKLIIQLDDPRSTSWNTARCWSDWRSEVRELHTINQYGHFRAYRAVLPSLRTVVCSRTQSYLHPLFHTFALTLTEVLDLLCGQYDRRILKIGMANDGSNEATMRSMAASVRPLDPPLKIVFKYQPTITVLPPITGCVLPGCTPTNLTTSNLYRLIQDPLRPGDFQRQINLDYSFNGEEALENWCDAEDIRILTHGIPRPTLFEIKTGAWKIIYPRTWSSDDVPLKVVEAQLRDDSTLREAITSAHHCVPSASA